jgi:hypothetical protein
LTTFKLPLDIETFIETVEKQIDASLAFVSSEDWSQLDNLYEKIDVHNMQFLFVDRNVKFAEELSTKASKQGFLTDPKIKSTIRKLLGIYEIYEQRYDHYITNMDYLKIIERRKGAKSQSEVARKSRTKLMDDEIKFQSDISVKVINLRTKVKEISLLDSTETVLIPTFNDTPIPLAMRDAFIRKVPQLKEILENKKNEAQTLSEGSGGESSNLPS